MSGRPNPLLLVWAAASVGVIGAALALAAVSPRFGYAYEVAEMPVLALTAALVSAGAAFACLIPLLIRRTTKRKLGNVRPILAVAFAAGLAARLVLFASEPVLEDDYQRYLWDGAVTATGLNPYAAAPAEAAAQGGVWAALAAQSGSVVEHIGYPELRTVYPPVAEATFALAYALGPWSLAAWRTVLLAADLTTLGLILKLLKEAERPLLWSALYWWNPVVLKEVYNSAHVDAVLLPFVLLALLLAWRRRATLAVLSLAAATGVKLWPALLLPLVWRASQTGKLRTLGLAVLFIVLLLLLAIPVALAGFDSQSGFIAYFARWKTSSALFPLIENAVKALSQGIDGANFAPWIARGIVLVGLAALSLALARKPVETIDEVIGRAALFVAALVLVSPAQFPWYTLWFAPFLAFRPWWGFLVLTATVPLYYASFYFAAHDRIGVFRHGIVWIEWVPVWAALAAEPLWRRCKHLANESVV